LPTPAWRFVLMASCCPACLVPATSTAGGGRTRVAEGRAVAAASRATGRSKEEPGRIEASEHAGGCTRWRKRQQHAGRCTNPWSSVGVEQGSVGRVETVPRANSLSVEGGSSLATAPSDRYRVSGGSRYGGATVAPCSLQC